MFVDFSPATTTWLQRVTSHTMSQKMDVF